MILNEIKINRLFNHFDHSVPLNHDEKITIITAPNGYGKTMILKILYSIFKGQFELIKDIDFAKIELVFDSCLLEITKDKENTIQFELNQKGATNKKDKKKFSIDLFSEKDISLPRLNHIADIVPHLSRVSHLEWFDPTEGEILSLNGVLTKYNHIAGFLGIKETNSLPDWLERIIKSVNVHFVKDQRLILRSEISNIDTTTPSSRRKKRTIDTIEKYSTELAELIASCNNEYSEVSKKLDSTLPARLLSKTKKIKVFDISTLSDKLNELKEKNEKLQKFNLLINNTTFTPDIAGIASDDIKVLSLYVQDNNEKLKVYDDLLSRIELFTTILNTKGLAFKKVNIDPRTGFNFCSDDGKELKLTQLSSGEQHEVILIFELIFIAKDNDLILIDEPEISLHIAWQKEFLEDIKKIIDIQNVSIIIATHSPQIIDNDWDLVVDLEQSK